MFATIINHFKPSPHIPRLPESQIPGLFKKYRWAVLESTFLGYASYYLVRNNISVAGKDIEHALNYSHEMFGNILAVSALSYGLGKFLMGALSDRSNPRKFMAFGLLLSAICNFAFGWIPNYSVHLLLWGLNGFIQGMGWPPCGRSIGHWFSLKERGSIFAVWNCAHNTGGALAGIIAAEATSRFGWQYAFVFPGIIATIMSVYIFLRLKDTPQSVGLPPIEEFKPIGEIPHLEVHAEERERELTFKELFVDNILKNKYIWIFASANFFVYIVRYSMLDWGPMYLREVKQATITGGGIAIFLTEAGGIPSTLLMGWLSDKLGGRRGMVSLLCMIPILLAFTGIYFNPPGHLWLDYVLLATVGFFIYPPVMLLGVTGLDLTSKKAVGVAAGFIGLFGYIGRTVQAKGFGWMADYYTNLYDKHTAWSYVIMTILACALMSIALLTLTWRVRPKA